MGKLSEEACQALEMLKAAREEANGVPALEWRTLDLYGHKLRNALARYKLIEARGTSTGGREYRITDYGDASLANVREAEARPPMKRGRKPGAPKQPAQGNFSVRSQIAPFNPNTEQQIAEHSVREHSPDPAPAPRPIYHAAGPDYVPPKVTPVVPEPLPDLSRHHPPDGCANCVYRQAVEIIGAKVPALLGLVEALKAIEAIGE